MSWPDVALGELAHVVGGSTPRRSIDAYWGPGHFWATPSDLPMPGEGILDLTETKQTITDKGLASSSTNLLPVGAVLYSTRATIGKLAIAKVPVATNQGFNNFIAGSAVDNRYLAYALQYFTPDIECLAGSTTFKEVSRSKIRRFKIPLPPPSEQRRIVEILDQADALRQRRREADAKAARILPALFLKMFGDPATNPMGWPTGPLASFGVKVRYGLGQPPKAAIDGLPLIRATNISAGTISTNNMIYVDRAAVPRSRNAVLHPSEVVVVRSGAYTGDAAQVTNEWDGAVVGYDLVATPPKEWTGEFLEQFLLMPFVQRGYFAPQRTRGGQPHLNSTQLEKTPAIAPNPAAQHEFAIDVDQVRLIRKALNTAASSLDALFINLLQRTFSGQLTAKWRQAHMDELLAEMREQARLLDLRMPESSAACEDGRVTTR